MTLQYRLVTFGVIDSANDVTASQSSNYYYFIVLQHWWMGVSQLFFKTFETLFISWDVKNKNSCNNNNNDVSCNNCWNVNVVNYYMYKNEHNLRYWNFTLATAALTSVSGIMCVLHGFQWMRVEVSLNMCKFLSWPRFSLLLSTSRKVPVLNSKLSPMFRKIS